MMMMMIIFGIETIKSSFKMKIKSTTNFENSVKIRSKTKHIKK